MATILQMAFLNLNFWMQIVSFWFTPICSHDPINNKPTWGRIMVWPQIGDKILSEPNDS